MNLFLNRESPVPLHDQLSAQIAQLVASGALASGARLPSIRALAGRLGVHHQTVLTVYKALAARGVLTIRSGSGVRVAEFEPSGEAWREGVALKAIAAYFVAQARARGFDEAAIEAAFQAALRPAPVARLVVVNPHPDLQALYLHELGEWLDFPMIGMALEAVEAEPLASRDETVWLSSTNHVPALQGLLGEGRVPVVLRLASFEPLLARVRKLAPGAIVAVVSGSERFLVLIPELLAGARGEGEVLAAAIDEPDRLSSVLRQAALVVTDSRCYGAIAGRTRAPIERLRLVADDVAEALVGRLPPEAFRPRAGVELQGPGMV